MKLAVKLTALALAVSAGAAQSTTVVSYNGFASTTGLTTIGSTGTAVTSDGTVLRVTSAGGSQSGAAWLCSR